MVRRQIDPWQAIEFALTLDDGFEMRQFLQDCLESDMETILADWREFDEFNEEQNVII